MSSVYDPRPLAFGENTNIRLVEVLCDDLPYTNPLITCKLHVVSLKDAPKYTALSYVWGSPETTRSVYLGATPFGVRYNLWALLWQYQRSGCKECLWIDALCIDQGRLEERNHQVAIMGQTFSSAELVIVWLGFELGP